MTGKEIVQDALLMLNYTDEKGVVRDGQVGDVFRRGVTILNLAYAALARAEGAAEEDIHPLPSLDCCIPILSARALDALKMRVAADIAAGEGDAEMQAYWAAQYNTAARGIGHVRARKDVFGGGN